MALVNSNRKIRKALFGMVIILLTPLSTLAQVSIPIYQIYQKSMPPIIQIPQKSPGKALALAISPVVVHGLGQAYNEEVAKSLTFFSLGVFGFGLMIYGSQTVDSYYDTKTEELVEIPKSGGAAALGSLIWIGSWVWSSVDAYRSANQKNLQLQMMRQLPKKSPSGALALALIPGAIVHGAGQIYNGDAKKALGFLGLEMLGLDLVIIGAYMQLSCCAEPDDDMAHPEQPMIINQMGGSHSTSAADAGDVVMAIGGLVWLGSYIWSAYDAYHSAHKKNIERGYAFYDCPVLPKIRISRGRSVLLTFSVGF